MIYGVAAVVVVAGLVALRLWGLRRRSDVLVDGSNVIYWQDNTPDLRTLRRVIRALVKTGYRPSMVFDANAGHLLFGRYADDAVLAGKLGLPVSRVLVVPKGTQADGYLLQVARENDLSIVTNDRFRDWQNRFPEVRRKGRLIRGRVDGRRVVFES
ncbi:hypothetical protein [uncultured Maritimibacter sp.]|jgi:hypothetical protein|uniref:NYN domain-containing protein n=1 Tax=uncultured Maritimibacter sp. TaxID=991866 RepID=UPI000AD461E7|nr:hypothetical protein [uncultured Maritimibacter sp.]